MKRFKEEDLMLGYFPKDLRSMVSVISFSQEERGTDFESRIKTTYEVKSGDLVLGVYRHTEVFNKSGGFKFEFGVMELKEGRIGDRPDWDEFFMSKAILTSRRSSCHKVHAGTIIVDRESNLELGSGYNGAGPGLDSCLEVGCRKDAIGEIYGEKHNTGSCWGTHSEQNAVSHITRVMKDPFTVYATIFPCNDCANNLLSYRAFSRLVFKSSYDEREVEGPLIRFQQRGVKVCRLDLSLERMMDIVFNEPSANITVWDSKERQMMEEYFNEIELKN